MSKVIAYKDHDRYVMQAVGSGGIAVSNEMAHALYELIRDEERYLSFYDDVRCRMEAQSIDVEKNKPMLEYICKNLADEIWQDELFWELEDKNIDYMIELYQNGEVIRGYDMKVSKHMEEKMDNEKQCSKEKTNEA